MAGFFLVLLWIPSCGNSGNSLTGEPSHPASSHTTISGSVSPQSGTQGDLAGWFLALIDKNSNIARMATVSSSGLFSFPRVYPDTSYTIGIFSPNHILRGVLAHPSETDLKVHPYFSISGTNTLPKLIYKGLTLSWQDTAGIIPGPELVSDADGDGIPEGVLKELANTSFGLIRGFRLGASADTDSDGRPNHSDSDDDDDGIIDLFDSDDDGDLADTGEQLWDVFDADANGDGKPDAQQQLPPVHYPRGANYAFAKFEMIPNGQGFNRFMTMVLKLHPSNNERLASVQVWNPETLPAILQNSTIIRDGSRTPWNGLLADDGQSEDGGPDDRVYGVKVQLRSEAMPEANQAIALELRYQTWSEVFIHVFPGIRPNPVLPAYNPPTRAITFHTNPDNPPYGRVNTFRWIIVVYETDSEGTDTVVYTSQPVAGSETSFTLPGNILSPRQSYKYKVIAQSLDIIPGHAVYKIESALLPINSN